MATRKTREQKGKKTMVQTTLIHEEKRPTCRLDPGGNVMPTPKSQRGRSSEESVAPVLLLQGAGENGAGARKKTTRNTTELLRMRETSRLQESRKALQRKEDAPQASLDAGEQDTSFESEEKDKDIQQTSEESEEYDVYEEDLNRELWPKIENMQKQIQQVLQVVTRFEKNMKQEVKMMRQDMKSMENNMSRIENKVQKVEDDVQNNYDEFTNYKGRVDNVEDSFTGWEIQRNQMMQKIDQLENQSRRNNVKILGLPEETEPMDTVVFFQDWIRATLNLDGPIELERAHRVGRRNQDRRPRSVLVRCLRYQDRERILRAAVQNARQNSAPLMIGGNRVLFYPDLSSEVVKKRKEFNPAKALLWQKGYKFSFQYPAALKIQSTGSDFLVFADPHQALLHARNLSAIRQVSEASNLQQDQGEMSEASNLQQDQGESLIQT